jgi:hypothetical protein
MATRFWHLTDPEGTRGLAEWDYPPGERLFEGPILCPVNPDHQGPGKRIPDLRVLLTSKRITDFVWTWSSECLVQDRVLQLLREQGFTGFEVRPVEARMKVREKEPDPCDDNPGLRADEATKVRIPTLWELVVVGWGGVAPAESGIGLMERCPGCGLEVYSDFTNASRLIDEKQWDGSDFFIVWPLPRYIFVADRVARFIRAQKLAGARLQRLDTLKKHPGVIPGIRPGGLSYVMPEPCAREIGEPLGIY